MLSQPILAARMRVPGSRVLPRSRRRARRAAPRPALGRHARDRPRHRRRHVTLAFRVRLDERDLLFDTVPKPARTLPDWVRILSVEKLQRQPDRIFIGRARIAFYRPGRQAVPLFELPFMRSVKGCRAARCRATAPTVEIVPVLSAGSSATLRDIKEPAPARGRSRSSCRSGSRRWRWPGGSRGARRRRRRPPPRRSRVAARRQPLRRRDPYDIALDRLAAIERERLGGARRRAALRGGHRRAARLPRGARRAGARADHVGAALGAAAALLEATARRRGSSRCSMRPTWSSSRAAGPTPATRPTFLGDARDAAARAGARRRPPAREAPMRFADPALPAAAPGPAGPRPGPGGARRRRAPDERIGFPGLAFLAGAPVSRRSRWPWLPDGAPAARPRAPDRGAGAAAGAARGAADPEQVAEHHGRARHLEQHEGGRLQAGQPAHGGAPGARPTSPASARATCSAW